MKVAKEIIDGLAKATKKTKKEIRDAISNIRTCAVCRTKTNDLSLGMYIPGEGRETEIQTPIGKKRTIFYGVCGLHDEINQEILNTIETGIIDYYANLH